MTEAQLSVTFVKQMRLNGWHTQKFEDKYSVGIPDVNVCKDGMEAWIELKVADFPSRMGSLIHTHMRDYQKSWNLNRLLAGGHCYLLVGIGNGAYLIRWSSIFQMDKSGCLLTEATFTKELLLRTAITNEILRHKYVPDVLYNDLESWNNA